MELVLKVAPNKTPFIGICMSDEKPLPSSVTYNKNAIYDIEVTIKKESVDLILLLEGMRVANFNDLKFLTPMAFDYFFKSEKPDGIYKFGYVHWSIRAQKYILTNPPFILKVRRVVLLF